MAADWITLKHIVVLMMENRSFDHMLGSLPGIGGMTMRARTPTSM